MNFPQPTPQSVRDLVEAEFASRKDELLAEVKKSISDVLRQDQRVIVVASQEKAEKKSHSTAIQSNALSRFSQRIRRSAHSAQNGTFTHTCSHLVATK